MLARPVASTVLYATARGVPIQRIVDATETALESLIDLEARVPERHMPAIWNVLAEAFPNQPLALEMASAVPLSPLGTVAHAAQFAQTLRAAIRLFLRYQAIFSPRLRLTLSEADKEARLVLFHPLDRLDGGRACELSLVVAARFGREVLGMGDALQGVAFAHDPTPPVAPCERQEEPERDRRDRHGPRRDVPLRPDRPPHGGPQADLREGLRGRAARPGPVQAAAAVGAAPAPQRRSAARPLQASWHDATRVPRGVSRAAQR